MNWTNRDLDREVARLDDARIYWNYNDELDSDSIAKMVEHGPDAVDEVSMELLDLNWEGLSELREGIVDAHLDEMRRCHGRVSESTERRFRRRCEAAGRPFEDADLAGLARNHRGLRFTATFLNESEGTSFEAWRGIRYADVAKELTEFCDLLNINPSRMSPLMDEDMELAPLPDIPERDGEEYVGVTEWLDELNNVSYGGGLTFMFTIDLADFLANPDGYRKGPLRLAKGTPCLIFDSCNGSGSQAEAYLRKPLDLAAGSYRLDYDDARRHSMQSVYGFTAAAWKAGSVTPIETPTQDE